MAEDSSTSSSFTESYEDPPSEEEVNARSIIEEIKKMLDSPFKKTTAHQIRELADKLEEKDRKLVDTILLSTAGKIETKEERMIFSCLYNDSTTSKRDVCAPECTRGYAPTGLPKCSVIVYEKNTRLKKFSSSASTSSGVVHVYVSSSSSMKDEEIQHIFDQESGASRIRVYQHNPKSMKYDKIATYVRQEQKKKEKKKDDEEEGWGWKAIVIVLVLLIIIIALALVMRYSHS